MKARVIIACEVPLATVSGLTVVVRKLVQYLGDFGSELHVVAPEGQRPTPVEIEARSTSIVSLPSVPLPQYPSLRLALTRTRRLQRIIDDVHPDIVHVMDPYVLGQGVLRACRDSKVPAVASYHTHLPAYLEHYGSPLLQRVLPPLEQLLWKWIRFNYRDAHEVICPTHAISDELSRHGVGPVSTWSRGVDTNQFSPARRDPALRSALLEGRRFLAVCVGRLAREKNIPFVVDALGAMEDVRLVFVGDGPARDRLDSDYASRGVRFVGSKGRADVARYLASADVFVFGSTTETYGQVLNEAMASGLPVVAVDSAVTREVMSDRPPGHIVPEDRRLFRAAVEEAVDLQRWPNTRARSLALERSWPAAMRSLMATYERAMHRNA